MKRTPSPPKNEASCDLWYRIRATGPHDLHRSLQLQANYTPDGSSDLAVFETAVRIDHRPVALQVRQVSPQPPTLAVRGKPHQPAAALRKIVKWMLFTDLDLRPFYTAITNHPLLAKIVSQLYGLKPIRPQTLFEMLVTAVTEQQISMIAAYRVRQRLIAKFGALIDGQALFPTPTRLARTRIDSLQKCGLSQRKAQYIRGLARQVSDTTLKLEAFTQMSDDAVRDAVTALHGFGRWSADYLLMRGLGRFNVVPATDLGVRTVTGHYLGDGRRFSPAEVNRALAPFAPQRGLAVFYLLAHARMSSSTSQFAGSG
jgi:DNA-3-methyladenine glycosylase II